MSKPARKLHPWEAETGCLSCGARAGERCRTVTTRYWLDSKPVRDGRKPGEPTTAHKARVGHWLGMQTVRAWLASSPPRPTATSRSG